MTRLRCHRPQDPCPETETHMHILLRAAAGLAAALITLTTAAGVLAETHRAPDGS